MESRQACRIARLAAHLDAGPEVATSSASPSDILRLATSASCTNFEPGRQLLNQVAIITGAGQGIGRAAALLFAQQGARVLVTDLDPSSAQATADFIRNSGGDAAALGGDVTAEDFPATAVAAVAAAFGGALHILVNNAGYTWDGAAHRMGREQWDAMLAVHVTAPFRLAQAAAPLMRDAAKAEAEAGGRPAPRCIINVSSVSGTHGSAGQANYSAAKAGVVGLTKALAREWGPFNIRVNALAYGYINTRLVQAKEKGAAIEVGGRRVALGIPKALGASAERVAAQIPLGRVGSPEEAAGAMLILASPYASYVSGQVLEVTGGAWL